LKSSTHHTKLLLIVPYTYPEFSGSGLNAFRFARYLVHNGYKATVLTFNRNNHFKHTERIDGVPIRRITYFNRNWLSKLFSLTWILPAYLIQVARHDMVCLYGSKIIGYEFVVLVSRSIRRKVIFQSLLAGVDDPKNMMCSPKGRTRPFYKFVLSRLSCFHSINTNFTRQYRETFPGKNNWIQSAQGVDIDLFSPAGESDKASIRKDMKIPQDLLVLLSVGFMIKRKRFDFLVDVLAGLKMPFLLLMVGEYAYADNHFLKDELAAGQVMLQEGKNKLGDRLRLTEPRHDIMNLYRAADIYVHAAIQEGLPNAILEAMASGLPVVSSKISGLEDFILFDHSNCLLADDREAFIRHIENLNNDQSLRNRIGKEGRAFVGQNASYGKLMEALDISLKPGDIL
jgi:glycosyltransferase involved in cell wall biosynthesis